MKKYIELNEKETIEMKSIVDEYSSIEEEFSIVQNELEKLSLKKDALLSKLDLIKIDEDKFFEHLKTEYGPGQYDILTMRYITE